MVTMDELEQRIESLKLLQDWSKWLIGLEAGACALLWDALKNDKAPYPLHKAWFMFWLSIVFAALLLIAIAAVARQRGPSGARNMRRLCVLVIAEYAFFIAGTIFLAWRAYKL